MSLSIDLLTYMIMKAEKSHDPPHARWKTQEADGVIQSDFRGLRTSVANRGNPGLKLGDRQCPSSIIQAGRAQLPLPPTFVSFRPSMDWVVSTLSGEGHLLY